MDKGGAGGGTVQGCAAGTRRAARDGTGHPRPDVRARARGAAGGAHLVPTAALLLTALGLLHSATNKEAKHCGGGDVNAMTGDATRRSYSRLSRSWHRP